MATLADTVKGLTTARNSIILVAAVAMIVVFILLALHVSTGGSMAPLYTGLTLEDSAKIIAELEKSSTPYEIIGNGSEILVPSERVLRLRMNMAQEGIPSVGSIVGYEIFDRSETLGSSNFVMNINMVRALEGELSRTIASISDVDSARVHLVMPKQEIFSRDKEKPSASVTIKMRGGHELEHSAVNAVTHLVAAAVPGLDASKVTVVDGHGRLLARGDGGDEDAATNNAQEYRIAYETRTQKQLEDIIEKVIGVGKVRVQVSADMNFDRTVVNSEKYDPEGQVVRSTQSNTERDNAQDKSAGESASAASNLPKTAVVPENGNSSNHLTERTDETTNYEISKTVQNHVTEGGNINKVSVAVLVDGTYSNDAYTPRTDEELQKLKLLVSSAIGLDEKRGDKLEVVNMRFTQESLDTQNESFFERFKLEMQSIIQTLIIAVVAILAIVMVLRPAVNQFIKQSQSSGARASAELSSMESGMAGRLPSGNMGDSGGGDAMQGDSDSMIDVANIKGGMKSSTMKKMNDIIDKYPDETMGVLRNWVARQT